MNGERCSSIFECRIIFKIFPEISDKNLNAKAAFKVVIVYLPSTCSSRGHTHAIFRTVLFHTTSLQCLCTD